MNLINILLNDLFNSILYKNIIVRYNIRNGSLLEGITTFLLDNIGKTFSSKNIRDYLKNDENIKLSPETVYNYLSYLESACLIKKVKRNEMEGKKILKLQEKYYITDHGFSQALIGRNESNISRLIENVVYFELLRRGYKVAIGKFKNYEIDFVAKKLDETIYIQVSYLLFDEKTKERELRPLLNIKDNFPKYIITTDKYDFSQMGIKHLNLIDFLVNDTI